jgi:hypothetical protein
MNDDDDDLRGSSNRHIANEFNANLLRRLYGIDVCMNISPLNVAIVITAC